MSVVSGLDGGLVSDLGNVLLMGQGGGLFFQRLGDGITGAHTVLR